MELNVEKKKEKKIMHEIQKILSAENQRRKNNTQTSPDGEGEQAFSTLQDQILCRKMQTTSMETELCSEVSV